MKNTIRIEREISKITQQKLAEMVGVSRQTISSIEHGKYIPSTILAIKISKVLRKKVEALFLLEEFD
jgi:putative transcriptional regulator